MGEGGGMYVKVMTDEQMEDLRRQISIYATICEQLVEMHRSVTAPIAEEKLLSETEEVNLYAEESYSEDNIYQHNDGSMSHGINMHQFNGGWLGSLDTDPLMTSAIHKVTPRQRWIPTAAQLQILENIFGRGNGSPSRQKIKEITNELSQHGQVSETNVYNWFQNRRARSKQKQASTAPAVAGSEVEEEIESPCEKETCSEKILDDPEHRRIEGMSQVQDTSRSSSSSSWAQMSFYQNILSNPRIDHLGGMMELPDGCSPFQSGESYGTN